jgi:hypothetical protein
MLDQLASKTSQYYLVNQKSGQVWVRIPFMPQNAHSPLKSPKIEAAMSGVPEAEVAQYMSPGMSVGVSLGF